MNIATVTHPIFRAEIDTFNTQTLWAKVSRVAKRIFEFIIFPLALIQYGLRKIMFPAPYRWAARDCDRIRAEMLNINTTTRQSVITVDGKTLDTVRINNPHSQRWILFLNGNAGCYESALPSLEHLSEATGQNVYCGNYRGVGSSKGSIHTCRDLLLDADAFMQDLLHQGVPVENITIHGHSMGAGVGCELATKYPGVRLVADRTYSSIADAASHLSSLSWAGSLTDLFGWTFDNYTNYLATSGPKTTIHHDICFLNGCGLYTKLAANDQLSPHAIQMHNRTYNPQEAHCAPLEDQALQSYVFFVNS